MRLHRTATVLAAGAAALILVGASHVSAHPRCQAFDATIADRVVDQGCPPPTQVCVVGTVRGKHGVRGTTVFVLGSRGEAPSTAPDQRPVTGTISYRLDDGSSLAARETSIGNVDPSTGTGHAGGTQEFTGGTGRYAGASGFAYLAQHYEVDHFVTHVSGEVCRARG